MQRSHKLIEELGHCQHAALLLQTACMQKLGFLLDHDDSAEGECLAEGLNGTIAAWNAKYPGEFYVVRPMTVNELQPRVTAVIHFEYKHPRLISRDRIAMAPKNKTAFLWRGHATRENEASCIAHNANPCSGAARFHAFVRVFSTTSLSTSMATSYVVLKKQKQK